MRLFEFSIETPNELNILYTKFFYSLWRFPNLDYVGKYHYYIH